MEVLYNHARTDSDSASEDVAQALGSASRCSEDRSKETRAATGTLDADFVIFKLLDACFQLGVDIGFHPRRCGESRALGSTAGDYFQIVETVRACARWAVENRVVAPCSRANKSDDAVGSKGQKSVPAGLPIRRKRSRHQRGGGTHVGYAAQHSSVSNCSGGAARHVEHGLIRTAGEHDHSKTQGRADATAREIAPRVRTPKEQRDGGDDEGEDEDVSSTRGEGSASTISSHHHRHMRRRLLAASAPRPSVSRISADSATRFCSL